MSTLSEGIGKLDIGIVGLVLCGEHLSEGRC